MRTPPLGLMHRHRSVQGVLMRDEVMSWLRTPRKMVVILSRAQVNGTSNSVSGTTTSVLRCDGGINADSSALRAVWVARLPPPPQPSSRNASNASEAPAPSASPSSRPGAPGPRARSHGRHEAHVARHGYMPCRTIVNSNASRRGSDEILTLTGE